VNRHGTDADGNQMSKREAFSREPRCKDELCARRLEADFGPGSPIAVSTMPVLLDALSLVSKRGGLFERWRALFAFSEAALQSVLAADSYRFSRGSRTGRPKPEEMVLAVQTYFALVVKLVTVAGALGREALAPLVESNDCARWAEWLRELEAGEPFATLGVENFPEDDLFTWYLGAFDVSIAAAVRGIAARVSEWALSVEGDLSCGQQELFGRLYSSLFPRTLRHPVGEYYTPQWLVDFVLDSVGYRGDSPVRLVDPSCGTGAFVVRAVGRALAKARKEGRAALEPPSDVGQAQIPPIVGLDVSPLAILATRANYILILAQAGMMPFGCRIRLPIKRHDIIRGLGERLPEDRRFDIVVGNPPWVLWDNLPGQYRERTKPLWRRYGLFSLSGRAGRLGGGKKDLSMLFLYRCVDRLLNDGGRLAFLIAQGVFKTRGAGEGFRRFCFEDRQKKVFIQVKRVYDITRLSPFPGASSKTALVVCQRSDRPTVFPVPYILLRSRPGKAETELEKTGRIDHKEGMTSLFAVPIDSSEPGSCWLTVPEAAIEPLRKVIGRSVYRAREGVNCAGLAGCFTVRVLRRLGQGCVLVENIVRAGKVKVRKVRAEVEEDLVYPKLMSGDLKRWQAKPSVHIILAQDPVRRAGIPEEVMQARFPKTLAYLRIFEKQLRARAAYKKYFSPARHPFWSMFNVGTYTLARWKVAWRIMGSTMEAAVLPQGGEKPVLPHNTHAFVPCQSEDEAHFLCALLNSSLVNFVVRSYSVIGGKGFAPPHILEYLAIPRFDRDSELHRRAVWLSKLGHKRAGRVGSLAWWGRIDGVAAQCFGILAGEHSFFAGN